LMYHGRFSPSSGEKRFVINVLRRTLTPSV
jgi:hypothetical protein